MRRRLPRVTRRAEAMSPEPPEPPEDVAGSVGPAVTVEPMRRRHLRAVLQLEERCSSQPWTMGIFRSELAQGDSREYMVARARGEVVGFAGLFQVLEDAHITNVGVCPTWRRRGVASRLLVSEAWAAIEQVTRGPRRCTGGSVSLLWVCGGATTPTTGKMRLSCGRGGSIRRVMRLGFESSRRGCCRVRRLRA